MSVFKDERKLKEYLKEEIKQMSYCKNVWVNKNFAREKFYSQGRKQFTKDPSEHIFPLAQPEIDLIVRDTNNKLFGIQIKYLKFEGHCIFPIRPGKNKHSYSYYVGLGQTLASLMFGFDCVSLWHCFDFEDETGDLGSIQRYAKTTNKLVTILNLPVNYHVLWIRRRRNIKEVVLLPLSPPHNKRWDELPHGLPPIYGKENPLRSTPEVQKINGFLQKKLGNYC